MTIGHDEMLTTSLSAQLCIYLSVFILLLVHTQTHNMEMIVGLAPNNTTSARAGYIPETPSRTVSPNIYADTVLGPPPAPTPQNRLKEAIAFDSNPAMLSNPNQTYNMLSGFLDN